MGCGVDSFPLTRADRLAVFSSVGLVIGVITTYLASDWYYMYCYTIVPGIRGYDCGNILMFPWLVTGVVTTSLTASILLANRFKRTRNTSFRLTVLPHTQTPSFTGPTEPRQPVHRSHPVDSELDSDSDSSQVTRPQVQSRPESGFTVHGSQSGSQVSGDPTPSRPREECA
jgi:hypothetical protein